jgi:hypothetical protein
VKCSDGRLYHPVVAEKAKEAWSAKLAQRARTDAARKAREEARQKQQQCLSQHLLQTTQIYVTDNVTESKGQGQGQGQGYVNPLPSSLRSEGPPPEQSEKVGKATTFKVWLQQIKAKGESPISGYKPVFEYCDGVGIPEDWLQLAWYEFRDRYLEDEKAIRKRYIDWRRVFLRSIKERWLDLWYFRDGKAAGLTTKGQQAQSANSERLAA